MFGTLAKFKAMRFPLRSGKTWLTFVGAILLALSVTSMGVFMKLSGAELHPYFPLATPIPTVFADATQRQMMAGWSGELFSMGVVCLGCAWSFRDDERASDQIAKWWGRGLGLQLCRYWVKPFLDDMDVSVWKPQWLVFFWVFFGFLWVWSEYLLRPPAPPKQPEVSPSASFDFSSYFTAPPKQSSPPPKKKMSLKNLIPGGGKKSDKKVK